MARASRGSAGLKLPSTLLRTALRLPAWWLPGLSSLLRTPKRVLSSSGACGGLRSSPRAFVKDGGRPARHPQAAQHHGDAADGPRDPVAVGARRRPVQGRPPHRARGAAGHQGHQVRRRLRRRHPSPSTHLPLGTTHRTSTPCAGTPQTSGRTCATSRRRTSSTARRRSPPRPRGARSTRRRRARVKLARARRRRARRPSSSPTRTMRRGCTWNCDRPRASI